MRARGDASGSVCTADTIADKYGVVKGSYTSIALPATETYQVGTLNIAGCSMKYGLSCCKVEMLAATYTIIILTLSSKG